MPGKNVVETLFEQYADGLPKTKEQERGRSVWKESLLHVSDHRTPVVEVSRRSTRLSGSERPGPDTEDGAPWRQHEPLLRAGQGDVHAPLIETEIYRR